MLESVQPNQPSSNTQTIIFMIALSFICALILSVLASALAVPKEIAKDLDRSKQLMIAAKILSHEGYFLIEEEGKYLPAKYASDGNLVEGSVKDIPTQSQLLQVYQKRVVPLLVDSQGAVKMFAEVQLKEEQYLTDYKKTGFYRQPWKLIYAILPNGAARDQNKKVLPQADAYVIPVNGMGLWDAIYGYLAIQPDGNTIIGTSWYDQKETPGLGANISEPDWQSLFPGKVLFQPSANGQTDFKTAPLGVTVVKGKVVDVYGNSPKAESAVDGMAGATLTGNGVTDAYRDVLKAYRPFLLKVHDAYVQSTTATPNPA